MSYSPESADLDLADLDCLELFDKSLEFYVFSYYISWMIDLFW